MTEFVKVQRLSNTVRVVIEPWFNGKYKIAAQQSPRTTAMVGK